MIDLDFYLRAACRHYGNKLFYPESNDPFRDRKTNRAKEICSTCLVQDQCLELAKSIGEFGRHGIWGGMTARERATHFRRQQRKKVTINA